MTRLCSEDTLIVRLKFSFPSNTLSSVMGTSNGTLISPAGIITVYGPDA